MLLMPHRLQQIIKKKSTYILYIKNKSIKTMKKKNRNKELGVAGHLNFGQGVAQAIPYG
jgi:hypothetical protein